MPQTTNLIMTLKRALKAHGKTYADVAEQLKLSEASIKRLFSEQSLSLQRLDQICQLIEIEISDLVQMMNDRGSHHLSGLAREQEQEIANDLELLLVTVCILNRWTLTDLMDYFHLTKTRCINHLAKLDRLRQIVINGMLAESSSALFQKKIVLLAKAYEELNNDDAGLPLDQRTGTTMVLALRNWRYGIFDQYTKNRSSQS